MNALMLASDSHAVRVQKALRGPRFTVAARMPCAASAWLRVRIAESINAGMNRHERTRKRVTEISGILALPIEMLIG
jgi:hypothetical protein